MLPTQVRRSNFNNEGMQMTLKNTKAYLFFSAVRDCLKWPKRSYTSPSQHFIKRECLIRNGWPAATWVESGTFLGQTTQLLAKYGAQFFSVKPEPTLFVRAFKLFSNHANIEPSTILHQLDFEPIAMGLTGTSSKISLSQRRHETRIFYLT